MDMAEAARTFRHTMDGFNGFWAVAGGWAIDFFLNRQTRQHEDLEVVVLRADASKLFQHFEGEHPRKIFAGDPPRFVPWAGDAIEPEVIQLRIDPQGSKEFDLLLSPSQGDEWICRRDETIRRPLSEVAILSAQGLPILSPEIVLLFKAKYLREKDHQDYASAWPRLPTANRDWLSMALNRVHPRHPWAK